jgi:hypothetical protein
VLVRRPERQTGQSSRKEAHSFPTRRAAIDDSGTAQGATPKKPTGERSRRDRREGARPTGREAAQEGSVFVPRKTRMQNDEWAGLLASGSAYLLHLPVPQRHDPFREVTEQWLHCSVRPRLQRRDRNGIAPFSLFFAPDAKSGVTPTSAAILTRAVRLSTTKSGPCLQNFQHACEPSPVCFKWERGKREIGPRGVVGR